MAGNDQTKKDQNKGAFSFFGKKKKKPPTTANPDANAAIKTRNRSNAISITAPQAAPAKPAWQAAKPTVSGAPKSMLGARMPVADAPKPAWQGAKPTATGKSTSTAIGANRAKGADESSESESEESKSEHPALKYATYEDDATPNAMPNTSHYSSPISDYGDESSESESESESEESKSEHPVLKYATYEEEAPDAKPNTSHYSSSVSNYGVQSSEESKSEDTEETTDAAPSASHYNTAPSASHYNTAPSTSHYNTAPSDSHYNTAPSDSHYNTAPSTSHYNPGYVSQSNYDYSDQSDDDSDSDSDDDDDDLLAGLEPEPGKFVTKAKPADYDREQEDATTFRGAARSWQPQINADHAQAGKAGPSPELNSLTTHYMDDAEKQKSTVGFADGKLTTADGKLMDTTAKEELSADRKRHVAVSGASGVGTQNMAGRGKHIFAMTPDGDYRAADPWAEKKLTPNKPGSNKHNLGFINHSSFVSGGEVAGAGELAVNQGELQQVSDSSGHYQPDGRMMKQTLDNFETKGVDMSRVDLKLVGKSKNQNPLIAPSHEFRNQADPLKAEEAMRARRAELAANIEQNIAIREVTAGRKGRQFTPGREQGEHSADEMAEAKQSMADKLKLNPAQPPSTAPYVKGQFNQAGKTNAVAEPEPEYASAGYTADSAPKRDESAQLPAASPIPEAKQGYAMQEFSEEKVAEVGRAEQMPASPPIAATAYQAEQKQGYEMQEFSEEKVDQVGRGYSKRRH